MYGRVNKIMSSITADYEIVYVNDRSRIMRWKFCELAGKDKRLIVINHSRNLEIRRLIRRYALCTGDAVILLDGDFRIPELFPEFVKNGWTAIKLFMDAPKRKGGLIRRICYKIFTVFSKTFLSGYSAGCRRFFPD